MQPSAPVIDPNAERRIAPRALSELPVRIGTGRALAHVRSMDLSTSGVLIARERPMPDPDSRLYDVFIDLPLPERPISAVARGVWSSGPYQALRFVRMSDDDRLELAEYMDRVLNGA